MRGRSSYWNPETERGIRRSEIFSHGLSKPTMTAQREAWEINNPILFLALLIFSEALCWPNSMESPMGKRAR